MLNLEEIDKTILDLEKHDTTYSTCERLAWLYIVRDHLAQQRKHDPLNVSGDSDFLLAVNGKDGSAAWNIMDVLMDTLKAAYPKAYDSVMRKMMEL